MSFFYHSSNFEAAAQCGRVVLTCNNAADMESVTDTDLPFVSSLLCVTAEFDGHSVRFDYDAQFWEDSEGRGLFEVIPVELDPWDETTKDYATAEKVKALESAAGGLPAVLYGAMEWTAKRCAAAMKEDALTFLSEVLEDENAA